ncbi:MAG TPA: hypothetical protein VGB75_20255 [Jatrophihabitans sp.]|uniref:hypothetical protein n=1 Tax=Jatrophihabitans sp. TaxID=1932789 RepID=UPI002F01C376
MIGWLFGVVFFMIGVLNAFLVHPVPGVFYLLLSTVYLPPAYTVLSEKSGLAIPLSVKLVVGLVVSWGTLAVGDLVDMID